MHEGCDAHLTASLVTSMYELRCRRVSCAAAAPARGVVREEGPRHAERIAGAPQEPWQHALAARRLQGAVAF